ncbi:cytochrome P450 [[Phormidium ambiguum] IAM M-71]|uniref:Cytochrome P450 n=1 Tax=[Phormidium ambiguum] IAM M-71 TaxID=454136 RepID=A0A1U7ISP4_9CYAN|nr:cytochrome P450 [Phormidium ambiguum]OKH40442.1 cytochrome P450 [Phormidium ambiguum IAM M-71]
MTTTTDNSRSLPLPPGNFGLPLIGETIEFLRDPDFMEKRQKRYGSIFKTRIFGANSIAIIGAEANRFILTNNQYFAVSWPKSTKILLGPNSLSLQEGSQHQSRRKLLSYAFQPKALAGYLPGMEKITQEYLQKWQSLGSLTWYPELRNYTFDIASTLLIATESGSQTSLSKLFKDWSDGLFSIPLALPWTKFGRALHSRKELLAEIEKIILRRQTQQEPGQDALGLMLEARDEEGNGFSLPELKDQVLVLLFAGHETVTSALGSFCLSLAQYPEVREKLRSEIRQVVGNDPLTMEHFKQMSYLEMVIKEALRLVPPVGGGFRKVVKSCEYNGYAIPEGWGVLYQIGRTHQDESVYSQPEKFDPERFSPERSEDKKPFSYLPFGGGMRECLGKAFAQLVMKVFAVHLVRDYSWELLPEQNLELVTIPTPHPKDGLKVNFERF